MLRIHDRALPAAVQQKLAEYQRGVDDAGVYAECVAKAKKSWKSYNCRSNATFSSVKTHLYEMGPPGRRCAYCEDSFADEVEHVVPKDWVPTLAFRWANYLYGCGPCNGPKSNRYGVIRHDDQVEELSRRRGDPPVASPDLPSALIDLRSEDPLDFLELDLDGTFWFLTRDDVSARDQARADFTREVLHLNDRESLVDARRAYFHNYRAHLRDAAARRAQDGAHAELGEVEQAVAMSYHRTVWAEMIRQRDDFDELAGLFAAVPEALGW